MSDLIERPRSIGEAWRKLIQQQAKIERLKANAVTMEEYINDIAKPKIERLRERCRIQDKLISDNADLHDTIERLENDAENLRNTITSTHLSLKERDVEIEALRAALKGVDAYPNTLRDLEDDK